MPIDPDSVGYETPPIPFAYDWRDTVKYALSVGASPETELDYLYEGRGPKVLPTFCTIPTFAAFDALVDRIGCDRSGMVHRSQDARLYKTIPPRGTLMVTGRVEGVYDLKRMATALFIVHAHDESGERIFRGEVGLVLLKDGGFGGPRPPRNERVVAPERPPDFETRELVPDTQALLYRLNGDYNPLHADPDFASKVGFERPILHGLCTFGYVGRAALQQCFDGDSDRFRGLRAQFSSPVFPGDTLIVRGWNAEDRVILSAVAAARPDEPCITQAFAISG